MIAIEVYKIPFSLYCPLYNMINIKVYSIEINMYMIYNIPSKGVALQIASRNTDKSRLTVYDIGSKTFV